MKIKRRKQVLVWVSAATGVRDLPVNRDEFRSFGVENGHSASDGFTQTRLMGHQGDVQLEGQLKVQRERD